MDTITLTPKSEATKAREHYISVLCNRTGLVTSFALIAYFLVMKYFHLDEILELRYFNVVILLLAILIAFSQYNKKKGGRGIYYLKGLRMGVHILLLAIVPFAIFMGIYLAIDTSFMGFIRSNLDYGYFLTPSITAICILMEGLSAGAIITFTAMQYFKEEPI